MANVGENIDTDADQNINGLPRSVTYSLGLPSTNETDNNFQVPGLVTLTSKCRTEEATHLCIQSPCTLLKNNFYMGIGSTYNNDKVDFWFDCLATPEAHFYLLSIFVTVRNADARPFTLYIPASLKGIAVNESKQCSEITGHSVKHFFQARVQDHVIHVKSYCFLKEDLEKLKDIPLLLPCAIDVHTIYAIDSTIISRLKIEYVVKIDESLYDVRDEDGDFILEAKNHEKYPVHGTVIAARSSVLKEEIEKGNKSIYLDLEDELVEILVEFLYKGTAENISLRNAKKIYDVAEQLKLPGLLRLATVTLSTEMVVSCI